MKDTKQLIEDIDSIKDLLEDAATYNRTPDEKRYAELRVKIISLSRIQTYLPSFMKTKTRLSEFRTMAQAQSTYAERRVFVRDSFAPVLDYLNEELKNPIGTSIFDVLTKVDSAHVVQACHKALDRVYDDPDGAITSARSLLETVCKYILDEQGTPYAKAADLPDLYKAAARSMHIAPDQQSEADMRQMLQGCFTVVQGLGALRNRVGDAHGKNADSGTVEKHHAILGVGIACSVASFLMESWQIHLEAAK